MSLVKKLVEIMGEVERIPKRGFNTFHQYAYATEADIAEALRSEMAKRGVLLLPSITGETRHPVGEKGSVLTVLEMEMEFFDSETGETIKKPWRGYGTDKEDKGGYKAMTGGEKYFLLKSFLMPTGDDPEAAEPATQGHQAARQAARPQSRQLPPPQAQRPAQASGGGLTVTGTDVKKGEKNGKAWTLFIVKLSDGREGRTFDAKIYEAAVACLQARTTVEVDLGEKNAIINFVPVRQLREA